MAAKKSNLEVASSKILERKGKKEVNWKAEILEAAQISFFRGSNKEIEEFVLNKARHELIFSEINK